MTCNKQGAGAAFSCVRLLLIDTDQLRNRSFKQVNAEMPLIESALMLSAFDRNAQHISLIAGMYKPNSILVAPAYVGGCIIRFSHIGN